MSKINKDTTIYLLSVRGAKKSQTGYGYDYFYIPVLLLGNHKPNYSNYDIQLLVAETVTMPVENGILQWNYLTGGIEHINPDTNNVVVYSQGRRGYYINRVDIKDIYPVKIKKNDTVELVPYKYSDDKNETVQFITEAIKKNIFLKTG